MKQLTCSEFTTASKPSVKEYYDNSCTNFPLLYNMLLLPMTAGVATIVTFMKDIYLRLVFGFERIGMVSASTFF